MKKTILTLSLLAGATAVYAQGTINWTDYVSPSKTGPGFGITVFGPATPTSPATDSLGNTINDTPAGTAVYAGAPLTTGFEVGLYVDTSATAVHNDVLNGAPVATQPFLTGASAGNWASPAGLDVTTAFAAGQPVFVELAAWSTSGGATSYATSTGAEGFSLVSDATATLGGGSPPQPAPTLQGLGITDFSVGSVPEPSTIALGVMGASAFLMRLRRK